MKQSLRDSCCFGGKPLHFLSHRTNYILSSFIPFALRGKWDEDKARLRTPIFSAPSFSPLGLVKEIASSLTQHLRMKLFGRQLHPSRNQSKVISWIEGYVFFQGQSSLRGLLMVGLRQDILDVFLLHWHLQREWVARPLSQHHPV